MYVLAMSSATRGLEASARICYAPDDGAAIGLDPAARERLGPTLTENLDAAALAEVLEELDTGVLVCTEQGHVMLANDAGRRELQCGRPLSLDATGALQIADDDGSTTAQCRMALRAAVRTQRRQLLALGEGAHRLMVAVTPLGRSSRPWALVLLGRRRPPSAGGLAHRRGGRSTRPQPALAPSRR